MPKGMRKSKRTSFLDDLDISELSSAVSRVQSASAASVRAL